MSAPVAPMSAPGATPDQRAPLSSDDGFGPREQMDRVVDTPSQDRPNRERGLAQKYSNAGQVTTLMLRNIPSMYTQDMLLEEIVDCMGSSDIFDFFYLPWDLQNDCNVGYAFVNFRDVTSAERCTRIFTNFNFRKFDSRRTCKVYPAHIQGLENNLRHLMDRAVSEARSHYPIIMWKGEKLKLGKVIEALHGQKTAPRSAPGKPLGDSHRSDTMSVPSWPPPQAQAYTHPNRAAMDAMSNMLADSDTSPFGGDVFGPGGGAIPPATAPGGHMPPASGPPPGLLAPPLSSSGPRANLAMESDMLQSLPELRAVLNQGLQNQGYFNQGYHQNKGPPPAPPMAPREPGMLPGTGAPHQGPMIPPASMPGRLPSTGHGIGAAPTAPPARPPLSTGVPGGMAGNSPTAGAAAAASSASLGSLPAMPPMSAPAPKIGGLGMQAPDSSAPVQQIGMRDPNLDVFRKFCQKFE